MSAQATAATSRLPRALTPFRHAAYRRLGLALFFSLLTTGLWIVALVWEVIRLGGGPGQLSLVTTAAAVGTVLPALLGGVVADRVPQKLILVVVESVHVLTFAGAALLSLTGLMELWHLALVAFVGGVAMAFYYPAYSAWLPALVPPEDLMAVNGFEGMLRPTIQQAAGPALAGLVIGALSPGAAMGLAAGVGLVGLAVLATVPLTPVRRDLAQNPSASPVGAMVRDVAEGFRYMVRTPWLLATLVFASLMILVMMGPLEVLIPFLLKDAMGGGPGDHALVLAGFGIGGAVGSLAMASMRMPRRYLTWMNLLWGLGCLPFVLIAFSSGIWQVIGSAFVLGVMFSAPMVIWGTLLQRRVPPHLLGRVASLDFFVSISLMPVSMALAGPVADLIGLRATFILAGTIPAVVAVVAIVWARLPADEIAHPLRDEAQGTAEAGRIGTPVGASEPIPDPIGQPCPEPAA